MSLKIMPNRVENIRSFVLLTCLLGVVQAATLPLIFIKNNNLSNNVLPNQHIFKDHRHDFGYIEYHPNGTLILQAYNEQADDDDDDSLSPKIKTKATSTPSTISTSSATSTTLSTPTTTQNLLLFKSILNAIRLTTSSKLVANPLNIKIYGDGVEQKFPPFLERIIQRIQSYFSVYKYTDTSAPVRHVTPAEAEVTEEVVNLSRATSTSADVEGSGGGGGLVEGDGGTAGELNGVVILSEEDEH